MKKDGSNSSTMAILDLRLCRVDDDGQYCYIISGGTTEELAYKRALIQVGYPGIGWLESDVEEWIVNRRKERE